MERDAINLSRVRADGSLIQFEQRPTGYRAYHFTPPGGERVRVPSVTTVLDKITPKDGLRDWFERIGIIGGVKCERAGLLAGFDPEEAVEVVREAGEGVDGVGRIAQTRGLGVHAILERYARDGDVPNPIDYPPEWRGYIRGLVRWLIDAELQPVAVEQLVAHHDLKYAGRFDVRGFVRGVDAIVDLKTREEPRVYFEALMQVAGYDLADQDSGSVPATTRIVVSVGADGSYVERQSPDVLLAVWRAALTYHNLMEPVRAAYRSQERTAKAAA